MAYKSIPAITAAGEPQTSSDNPGKEAIDICTSAWNCAHDEQVERQINPLDCEKNSHRETSKNN